MKFVQRPLLSQSLQFKQFLSPQLIQKFNILQHSFSELEHAISEMLTENVMIESNSTESLHSVSFKQVDISETSSTLHDNITLKEYLVKQLRLLGVSEKDYQIMYQLIDALDNRGYLTNFDSVSSNLMTRFNVSKRHVQKLLLLLQDFEPDGVGARDLSECLAIQIKHYDFDQISLKDPILLIVTQYLTELSEKKYSYISQKANLSIEAVELIARFVKENLSPNPGSSFSSHSLFIRPSFSVKLKEGQLKIINLEQQKTTGLTLSSKRHSLLNEAKNDANAKLFLEEQLKKAEQFIESVKQRHEKLNQLINYIVQHQNSAFKYGLSYLIPLQQSVISQHLSLSASMISRSLSQKYIETDFGVLSLKQFCPRNYFGLTKDRFIELISSILSEKKLASDSEICRCLNDRGISIARRTVAKYRKLANVPARFPSIGQKKNKL